MVDEEPLPGEHGAGTLLERPVEEEMRSSYIDYAMSVIVGRALPDARDGLKPVHRRILYSLQDMGLTPDKPPRKSARLVGEVLGKYHPHGDTAVYDAFVRMAQDFSLRYPLVDGQGNFGSIDGDSPAAMRYTEGRMAPIAAELLEDLDKDTVDFEPNFDASLEEPTVLPAALPNLLVNGSSGIAVGMATNMAPHNLHEVCDAIQLVLDNPEATLEELMEAVPGPDFPTGGIVMGRRGILKAYGTGHGVVKVRARTEVEETESGHRLVVTEIPYQVNKSKLLTDIADLVRAERIEGIRDLRDESDREGLRVVVELKRGAMPEIVLNNLFKHTQLESSFGILNVALVDGEPEVLTLKRLIEVYIDHRLVVVERRTRYLLQKAKDRMHIVEGLLVALDAIDEVIQRIRASADTQAARENLMDEFELSEEQARAILEMRLSRLTSLEVQNLRDEQAQLRDDIARYEGILADEAKRRALVREELEAVRDKYGDERRTELVEEEGEDLVIEDLVPDEPVVIMMTNDGYVKRVSLEAYRQQRRGGKGLIGMRTKEEDYVVDLFVGTNHQRILFVTEDGIVHALKALQIPEMDRYARGSPIVGLFDRLDPGTAIEAALPVEAFTEDRYLFFATRNGKVKKTPLSEYERINVNGKIALRLEEGDRLVGCAITEGDDDIVLVKDSGKGVRFHEEQVRPMGRVAAGVKGTECRGDERVVSMVVVRDADAALLTVTSKGKGKRTPFDSYNRKNRGVWGVYMHEVDEETGPVIGAVEVRDDDEVLFTSRNGIIIRSPAKDIRLITSGQAKGVIVQQLDEGDETVAVARLAPEVVENGNGGADGAGGDGDDTDGDGTAPDVADDGDA